MLEFTPPSGIITAIMTPLNSDGRLKREAFTQLLDLQHSAGIDGVFAAGTFGEGPYLSLSTKKELVSFVAERSRLPVIVHVGGAVFDEILDLTRHCDEYDNVCAIAAVGPFYFRPDASALVEFYGDIATASSKPVLVYNNPGRQGYAIDPDVFGKISHAVSRVLGIKDTSNDLGQLRTLVDRFGASHCVYGAGDATAVEQLQLGVRGHICGIGNVLPEIVVRMKKALLLGQEAEAMHLQAEMNAIGDILRGFELDIAPYKELLKLRGIDAGVPAKPLRPLAEDERKMLLDEVRPLFDHLLP